jgi:hypothetical protein
MGGQAGQDVAIAGSGWQGINCQFTGVCGADAAAIGHLHSYWVCRSCCVNVGARGLEVMPCSAGVGDAIVGDLRWGTATSVVDNVCINISISC